MKKILLASLLASTALLTACGDHEHDDTHKPAVEVLATAEQNAKALTPEAEKVTFGDEGGPTASDTATTTETTTETADDKADDTKADDKKSDEQPAETADDKKADDNSGEQPADEQKTDGK